MSQKVQQENLQESMEIPGEKNEEGIQTFDETIDANANVQEEADQTNESKRKQAIQRKALSMSKKQIFVGYMWQFASASTAETRQNRKDCIRRLIESNRLIDQRGLLYKWTVNQDKNLVNPMKNLCLF